MFFINKNLNKLFKYNFEKARRELSEPKIKVTSGNVCLSHELKRLKIFFLKILMKN